MLVTNILVHVAEIENAPLVTFLELKEILSKDWSAKGREASGYSLLEIDQRRIDLYWLSSPALVK